MVLSLSHQMFVLNVAWIASLCLVIAFVLARCFRSLPKQYGILAAGLLVTLASPMLALLGTQYSLGILPRVPVSAAIDLSLTADISDPTQIAVEQPMELQTDAMAVTIETNRNPLTSDIPSQSGTAAAGSLQPSVPSEEISDLLAARSTVRDLNWFATVAEVAIIAWLIGSLIAIARFWRQQIACQRFIRTCRPVRSSAVTTLFELLRERTIVSGRVSLLESDHLPAPVVVGVWSPTIILPTGIENTLTPNQLRGVLAHEFSHIRRGDLWTGALQSICKIMYWWNPLLSLVASKMSILREMICDDIAASKDASDAHPVSARAYAQSLLCIAERVLDAQARPASLGMSFLSVGQLESRIRRILTVEPSRVELRMNRGFAWTLGLLAMLFAFGLPFVQIRSQEIDPLSSTFPAEPSESADATDSDVRPAIRTIKANYTDARAVDIESTNGAIRVQRDNSVKGVEISALIRRVEGAPGNRASKEEIESLARAAKLIAEKNDQGQLKVRVAFPERGPVENAGQEQKYQGEIGCEVEFVVRADSIVDLVAQSMSGDIQVLGGVGTLTLNTTTGGIEVRDAAGAVTAESIRGDVTVQLADTARDDILAKSISGAVHLALHSTWVGKYHVESTQGTYTSTFDSSDGENSKPSVRTTSIAQPGYPIDVRGAIGEPDEQRGPTAMAKLSSDTGNIHKSIIIHADAKHVGESMDPGDSSINIFIPDRAPDPPADSSLASALVPPPRPPASTS